MYKIGDKIVYPMHGAGVIESIQTQEILGVTKSYYVLKMPVGDMKLMIPTDGVNEAGIRTVSDDTKIDDVISSLDVPVDLDSTTSWNKRYRENMTKIKSGDIFEVADVVKSLFVRENEKGLSTGERKMLSNAKQILMSELVLVKGQENIEVDGLLSKIKKS